MSNLTRSASREHILTLRKRINDSPAGPRFPQGYELQRLKADCGPSDAHFGLIVVDRSPHRQNGPCLGSQTLELSRTYRERCELVGCNFVVDHRGAKIVRWAQPVFSRCPRHVEHQPRRQH